MKTLREFRGIFIEREVQDETDEFLVQVTKIGKVNGVIVLDIAGKTVNTNRFAEIIEEMVQSF